MRIITNVCNIHFLFICNLQFLVLVSGMKVYQAIYQASTQLKVSQTSLIGIVQDWKVHGNLKTYKPLKRRKDFFEKLKPEQLQLFRLIIHDMFRKINEKKKDKTAEGGDTVPTVKNILKGKYAIMLQNLHFENSATSYHT